MPKSSASVASSSKPTSDPWAFAEPEQPGAARARNLAARAAAKPWERVSPVGHACGLCDKPKMTLVKMTKLGGKGHVMACGDCLAELMGKSEMVE